MVEASGTTGTPHYLLDPVLNVILVSARHARNLPGRKTDVLDAQWLAKLSAHGLVRASFVLPEFIYVSYMTSPDLELFRRREDWPVRRPLRPHRTDAPGPWWPTGTCSLTAPYSKPSVPITSMHPLQNDRAPRHQPIPPSWLQRPSSRRLPTPTDARNSMSVLLTTAHSHLPSPRSEVRLPCNTFTSGNISRCTETRVNVGRVYIG